MAKRCGDRVEATRSAQLSLFGIALLMAACDAADPMPARTTVVPSLEQVAVTVPHEAFVAAYAEGFASAGGSVPEGDLHYPPSAGVAKALADARLAGRRWPEGLPEYARSGALREAFRAQMREYDMDPDNLADVHAARRGVQLAIARNRALTPDAMRALRDEMRPQWEVRLALEPLAGNARQRLGETAVLDAALEGAEYAALQAEDDVASLRRFREEVARRLSGGPDPTR